MSRRTFAAVLAALCVLSVVLSSNAQAKSIRAPRPHTSSMSAAAKQRFFHYNAARQSFVFGLPNPNVTIVANTPTPTATAVPPTNTPVPTATNTPAPTSTPVATATATPVPMPIFPPPPAFMSLPGKNTTTSVTQFRNPCTLKWLNGSGVLYNHYSQVDTGTEVSGETDYLKYFVSSDHKIEVLVNDHETRGSYFTTNLFTAEVQTHTEIRVKGDLVYVADSDIGVTKNLSTAEILLSHDNETSTPCSGNLLASLSQS